MLVIGYILCMLLKAIILSLFFTLAYTLAVAQDNAPGTAVYMELLGKGFISGNVDLPVGPKRRLTLGLTMLDHEFEKAAYETEFPTQTLPTPSIMYFHLFGQDRHFFEAGYGASLSPVFWKDYSNNDSALSFHGCLGYRYQAPDQLLLRIGFTPFYRVNWAFLPLVGVSVGYSW